MSVKTSPPSRTRPRAADDHPSGDPRFSLIDRTLKRFSFQQDALIEVLHTAQEAFGYLSDDLLIYVAHQLKLPLSWVYGVATFYHFFTLTPQGQHNCIVCMGTACYVKRAAEIVAALQQEFQVVAGETTADGRLSLSTARCLGSCGLAPVLVLDGEVLPRETPESALERVRQQLLSGSVRSAAKTVKNGGAGNGEE
ncbi:MAG TPA: bidirectional hydrogenase complex protein HoxE [Chloroflexi bacterium]|nr:bidirectional hydrogenase complex protein HoxE [Chloroflexota bacterium]